MKNRLVLFFVVISTPIAPILKAEINDQYVPPKSENQTNKAPEKPQGPNIEKQFENVGDALTGDNPQDSKQNKNLESTKYVEHPSTEIHEKQNVSEFKTQTNVEQKIQDKTAFSGIRPEDATGSTKFSEESQDSATQEQFENSDNVSDSSNSKSSTFFGISFDKKALMYYGVGAIAIVIICGVTYVLYKNGTLKKISNYIGDYIVEHKFEVKAAVGTACILAFAGIYVKKGGI